MFKSDEKNVRNKWIFHNKTYKPTPHVTIIFK